MHPQECWVNLAKLETCPRSQRDELEGLELEAALPAPSLIQSTAGGQETGVGFSGTIRRAGALCCFQVSPRLAGAAQVQMFAKAAKPPPSRGRWRSFRLHCYAWLFLQGDSLLSVPESKEPLIQEELCVPTLISHKSGLRTLQRERFTF